MPDEEPAIRRIEEHESAAVVELWDRMAREVPGGGPLPERGRRNLRRMLEISSWHRDVFCLVAVPADGDAPVGFAMGSVDDGGGLLPGLAGEVEEVYVPADRDGADDLRRQLAKAVVSELNARGCTSTIRVFTDAEDTASRILFEDLGFEADIVVLSLYQHMGRTVSP